jgi:hypothetical protein
MFKRMVKKVTSKVMDEDTTIRPTSQVDFLRDFLSKHNYVFSEDFEENLGILKKKHLVDDFVVTNFDGSVIVSSTGNGQRDGIMGTAMFSYIKSELPDSDAVLIKREEGWFMLFALNQKVFIVRAGSDLSGIELKALALELSILMEENKETKKEKKVAR